MIRTRFCDEGFAKLDEIPADRVPTMITDIRDANPGARFTDNKVQIVTAIIVEWFEQMIAVAMEHLDAHLWEMSMWNSELVAAKEWRRDHCPKGCAGKWMEFLRNSSPEIVVTGFKVLAKRFRQTLGTGPVSKRDVQQARPKHAEIERMQASMALAYNWILPQASQQEPRIVDSLRERVEDLLDVQRVDC